MASVKQIYDVLDSLFPFSTQENWDNSGILINSGKDCNTVVCCLDVSEKVVDFATKNGAKIIVSHHPLIFSGIKSVSCNDVVYKIIKNDISVISAHTNFDKYEFGTCYNMAKALELTVLPNDFEIGVLAECKQQTVKEFAQKCKAVFGTAGYTMPEKSVNRVFICAGAGSGMKDEVLSSGADILLTGECKYHDMLDLSQAGVGTVFVGHDVSEKISVDTLKNIISENIQGINVYTCAEDDLVKYITGEN